jgi:hypothetical protein
VPAQLRHGHLMPLMMMLLLSLLPETGPKSIVCHHASGTHELPSPQEGCAEKKKAALLFFFQREKNTNSTSMFPKTQP